MSSFYFRKLQLFAVLLLICDSYMSWNTRFVPLKLCGIFHFGLRFIFNKLYISVIIPFKIKIREKPQTVLLPGPWFLSYNKKLQLLKIQWYLRELKLPKTDLVTIFLNLENRNFQRVSFSSNFYINIWHSFS